MDGQINDELAWNLSSPKYLRQGTVNGRPAQMLIDTGCNQTVVLSRLISKDRLDHQDTVPMLCAHGDTKCYPTAWVEFRVGSWVC